MKVNNVQTMRQSSIESIDKSTDSIKVYTLTGKSGTGKSYQAVNLCRQMNIESIIDDGLLISRNKVVAGKSAKRQPTKIGAVKTALFITDEHATDVKQGIEHIATDSLLVIGTSDDMADKIIARLGLPAPVRRIYIEDITTKEERETARKQRQEQGQHVIPAPTFQIKRQFSGYFMSPMRIIREFGPWRDTSEKSVVRPAYSYMGEYKISEKVMRDIVECIKNETAEVCDVAKVVVTEIKDASWEGIEIRVTAALHYGENLPAAAEDFQKNIAEKIEDMTAFNVRRVDLDIRDVV